MFSGTLVELQCNATQSIQWKHNITNSITINEFCIIDGSRYHCSYLSFVATNGTVIAQCFTNNGTVCNAVSELFNIETQGLLDAPQDLAVTNDTADCGSCVPLSWTLPPQDSAASSRTTACETCVQLSWTPPFSLNVSDVEPDIKMYTVYTRSTDTGMMAKRNVTLPKYTFGALSDTDARAEISVSAWNEVGEGERCGTIEVRLPRSRKEQNSAAAASFVCNISAVICAIVALLILL